MKWELRESRTDKEEVSSEVGLFCLGLRKQVLVEEIAVVLGADGLQHRAVELEPSPCHGERRIERVGVLHLHQSGHAFAARLDGEALHYMQPLAMRRAKIVDVADPGGEADGID